jgi:hypothetical protein
VSGRRGRIALLVLGLAAALAAAVGLTAWALDQRDDEEMAASTEPTGGARVSADARQLARNAVSVGHAVYWIGPLPNRRYELTQTQDGRAYVRYLPPGVAAGDPRPGFLTVGTYLLQDAYAVTAETADRADARPVPAPGGAVAFYTTARPQSVYLAYEGSDLQIEVFHPTPREARRLVSSGRVRPVG